MYKFIGLCLLMIGMSTTAYTQQKQDMNSLSSNHKILVAYFSATGTTARVAERLAKAANAELYAITPSEPYTNADLDWHDRQSRSSVEMNDPKSRPAIKNAKDNIADYDVIFLGYPIWWDLAPRVVNTFLEGLEMKGQTIIPFATSGGSSITNSVATLKRTYPELNWKEGRLLNSVNDSALKEWINKLGILQ